MLPKTYCTIDTTPLGRLRRESFRKHRWLHVAAWQQQAGGRDPRYHRGPGTRLSLCLSRDLDRLWFSWVCKRDWHVTRQD